MVMTIKQANIKIALLGYGRMGRLLERRAIQQGHSILARFSPRSDGSLQTHVSTLNQVDVAIDFSHASVALEHLKVCLSLGKPIVIGTTGWENELPIARALVEQADGQCLFAPNFSIGGYLFQQVVKYAASLLQAFPAYDVAGTESHHREKRDHPSGTAKGLAQEILQQMPRVKELAFSSVRCGHMPGTHTLYFDSAVDTLTLTHEARSREGFADGALLAAAWLMQRRGFFNLNDMMETLS